MKRREFITLLGGATAWPINGRAQQAAMPVIGYFSSRSFGTEGPIRGPFLTALEEAGFVAGRNVAIEYRFSEGRDERLSQIAADLVGQVSMLVATDRPSAMAAKAATATIPIVFTSGLDPVQIGLVASFNRPGGNATGVGLFSTELGPKRREFNGAREYFRRPSLPNQLISKGESCARGFCTPLSVLRDHRRGKQRSGRQRYALYLRSLRAFARRRPAPPLFESMNSTPTASKARFTTSSVARLSLCNSSCLAVALSPALRTVVHSWSHSGASTSSRLMGSNSSIG